jgi:NAD+ kinase
MSDFSRRPRDEGQLRYWTSEMCSNSPHLFDFVVTVSDHAFATSDAVAPR